MNQRIPWKKNISRSDVSAIILIYRYSEENETNKKSAQHSERVSVARARARVCMCVRARALVLDREGSCMFVSTDLG